MPLSHQYTRVIDGRLSVDDGGVVNFTNSKALFEQSFKKLAKTVATNFRGVIFNAF